MSLKKAAQQKKQRPNSLKEEAIRAVSKDDFHRYNVLIPKSEFKKFKAQTSLDGVAMSDLINQWIYKYLNK